MKRLYVFLVSLFLFVFPILSAFALAPKIVQVEPQNAKSPMVGLTPQNAVEGQIWANYPLLKHIASCESWGDANKEPREFNASGTVLRGFPNPDDVGLAQINIPTWGAKAQQLGFDLFTYQGNLDMAKWIFDRYGAGPWKYSKTCWASYAQ